MPEPDPILAARGIVKRFAGVTALAGVDFTVLPGEIHALLGQNGAGKSTLVKILNGVHPAGSFDGTVTLAGETVAFASPAAARSRGVAYVPQEIEVLEQLSVAENVFVGQTGLGDRLVRRRELERRAAAILDELGVALDPRALVASLTSAERHLVMIARALATRPRVLMLDEPTASLAGTEVAALFAVLRRLRAAGVTMVYITHRLPEVIAVCDRVTVLRDGRVAARLARDEFDEETFIFTMSGQRLQKIFPAHAIRPGATRPLLEVAGLSVPAGPGAGRGVRDVSFSVAPGEILGLAGLLGSGRSEILHGIYGRVAAAKTIRVDGRPVTIRSPADARAAGIALLTEDRKRDGLLFNMAVGANITIGNLAPLAARGIVRPDREKSAILAAMRQLNVKAASPQASPAHLSGGNQQKLLFARVLMRSPRILMLDEPTKGVDAATRHEIYKLVVALAEKGVALVLVASELEELIGLCDRFLTVAEGRIVDTFRRGEGDEARILRAVAAAQAETVRAAS